MSVFKLNNRYGYIDITGKIVIKPRFVEAFHFCKGKAIVKENEEGREWWFINSKGNRLERAVIYEKWVADLESAANETID